MSGLMNGGSGGSEIQKILPGPAVNEPRLNGNHCAVQSSAPIVFLREVGYHHYRYEIVDECMICGEFTCPER